jgi:hypothetical protein
MTTTKDAGTYSLVAGGYRVRFTNWRNGDNEQFFGTWVDAQNYLMKFEAYGYKGKIETIYFNIKEGNE